MSLNDQKFSDRVPNKIYVVSTCVGPPKKFQIFITIFVRSLHSFVIGSFYKKQGKNKNDYIVHIMSENGLCMIDLVLTHLDHCWGPLDGLMH